MRGSWQRTAVALGLLCLILVAPAAAQATPHTLAPANGALVPSNAQVFSWQDNLSQGPIDHWYMEISTSPQVDYYPWGFFSGGLVFTSSQRTSSPSPVNLNSLGRALAPGTYYWHVVGYYGPFGSLGTAWSGVQSFTVYGAVAAAPKIGVNPTSLTFWAEQGDATWHVETIDISNTGGGTLYFTASKPVSEAWWAFGTLTNTGYVATLQVGANANGLTPGTYSSQVTIADNGSTPPATNSPRLVPVTLRVFASDTTAPTGTIKIRAGRAATNTAKVTLNLSASDTGSGVGEMRFNNGDGLWSAWVPYATTRTGWRLPEGDGTKTVQAQFRDKTGNASTVASDTIILDTVKPTTEAPRSVSVRRYQYVRLYYKVVDPQLCATKATAVTIKIKTLGGVTKKTLKLGARSVNTLLSYRFKCSLAKKTYKFYVYATDGAGNTQAKVGWNRLVVR
jgi:hypothetical protein